MRLDTLFNSLFVDFPEEPEQPGSDKKTKEIKTKTYDIFIKGLSSKQVNSENLSLLNFFKEGAGFITVKKDADVDIEDKIAIALNVSFKSPFLKEVSLNLILAEGSIDSLENEMEKTDLRTVRSLCQFQDSLQPHQENEEIIDCCLESFRHFYPHEEESELKRKALSALAYLAAIVPGENSLLETLIDKHGDHLDSSFSLPHLTPDSKEETCDGTLTWLVCKNADANVVEKFFEKFPGANFSSSPSNPDGFYHGETGLRMVIDRRLAGLAIKILQTQPMVDINIYPRNREVVGETMLYIANNKNLMGVVDEILNRKDADINIKPSDRPSLLVTLSRNEDWAQVQMILDNYPDADFRGVLDLALNADQRFIANQIYNKHPASQAEMSEQMTINRR